MAARRTEVETAGTGGGHGAEVHGPVATAARRPVASAQSLSLAITGLACRLPGADTPEALWSMLWAGDDAIGMIPEDRWAAVTFDGTPPASGRSYTRAAGVLDNIWDFDAAFFGISAREAAQMDPQQRLMLELAWEALEDAGLPGGAYRRNPDDPSGPGRTGVYIGAASMDHAQRFASDAAGIDSPFMTGNTLSIIANRISHFFDFQGPSLTIDTACASSMTALHLAAGALERGEIDTAVVGGVNLLLQPFNFVGFSRAGMLSPSGRCRPFDAAADGYVRGEGGVVIVLRRLDAALGGGEPVQAVLAASGIGTDGHKVGLTRPAVAAQASLVAAVHEAAALPPGALAFVEAHGTGTPTGDPVEAAAIATAVGPAREGLAPLPIGSIKGAIGHLEPAAGLAGLLKAVLSLREGKLPASPHVNTVNPAVAAEEAVTVALANAPLMHATGTVPAAGVSSFGFGGANAHVVLRAPAPEETAPAISPGTATSHLPALTLSAATEDALAALAARWQGQAAGSATAQTAARRTLMAERAVIAAQTTETQAAALDALGGGRSHPALTRCHALPPDRAGIAFFYAGNGGQWAGMGERLLADDAAARRGFAESRDALVAAGGPDPKALMADPALEARLADSVAAQTLLFAQQVATTAALHHAGLTPALVAGHSVGEVTAAWAAGCLDLAAAARLIVGRATAIEPLRDSGTMAALLSDAETALSLIEAAGLAREVCLAAENSQRSVTLSGTREGIETLARVARERRLALRRLPVAYPYHAAPLEQVEQAMRETFAGISGRAGTIPLASTVTGGLIEGTALDEAHWWANARRPVRFRAVVEGAAASGCGFFVEIGPRPILSSYIRDTLGEAAEDAIITATENAPPTRTGSRGTAEDGGAAPAAQRIAALARATEAQGTAAAPLGPAVAGLPRYPWQHNHHRAAPSATAIDLFGVDCKDALIRPRTPLLGGRDRAGEGAWHGTADVTQTPWLAEHRIAGHCLAPAALFAALAIEALHRESPPRAAGVAPAVELVDLAIDAPLALLDERAIALRTQLDREGRQILISAAGGMGGAWQTHARARFRQPAAPIEGRHYAADAGSTAQAHTALAHELYAALERHGLAYGPAFQRLTEIEVSADYTRATIAAPGRVDASSDRAPARLPDARAFALHPTVLDAAFHALMPLIAAAEPEHDAPFLPVRITRLRLAKAADPDQPLRVTARLTRRGLRSMEATLSLHDPQGAPVAVLEGLGLERADRATGSSTSTVPVAWQRTFRTISPAPAAPLAETAVDLAAKLRAAGILAPSPIAPDPLARLEPGAILLEEICRTQMAAVVAALRDTADQDQGPSTDKARARLAEVAAGRPAPTGETTSDLVRGLLAHDPRRGTDVQMALDLPEHAVALVAEAGEEAAAAPTPGVAAPLPGPRQSALEEAATAAAETWLAERGDRPARICAIGLSAAACKRLSAHESAADLVAWAGADDGTETPIEVDLLLIAGATGSLGQAQRSKLMDSMAPDGLLLAAEVDPQGDTLAALSSLALPQDAWRAAGATVTCMALATPALAGTLLAGRPPVLHPKGTAETTADEAYVWLSDQPDTAAAPEADARHVPVEATQCDWRPMGRPGRLAGRTVIVMPPLQPGEAEPPDTLQGVDVQEASPHPVVPTTEALEAPIERRIALCRALARRAPADRPHCIVFLSRTAEAPFSAAIAALRRVLVNEMPDIRWRLLTLPDGTVAAAPQTIDSLRRLVDPANALVAEGEATLHADGQLSAPRHMPTTPSQTPPPASDAGWNLSPARPRDLSSLSWQTIATSEDATAIDNACDDAASRPAYRPSPARRAASVPQALPPGAALVRVEAAALNFRDVMAALGRLPPLALENGFTGARLGMEMAGSVIAVGEGVSLAPGTAVMGFAPGALASTVVTDARLLAPRPSALDPVEAAALPAAYLTASRALEGLAQLREGETVLIHGATGGVGLAAMAIAARCGARVFATAGTPAKRRFAKAQGALDAFDSRGTDFVDRLRAATDGRGADVVLNALAGDALRRGLDALAPFGRFVELGKADLVANTALPLRPFLRSLSFLTLDADLLLAMAPEGIAEALEEIGVAVAERKLPPLPVQCFDATQAPQAFDRMRRGAHLGKLVITPPQPAESTAVPAPQGSAMGRRRQPVPLTTTTRSAETWIIAGGTGGIGLALGAAIAHRRRANVWLLARREPSAEVKAEIARQQAAGADLRLHLGDAAAPETLQALCDQLSAADAQVAGILHAAVTAEDGPIASQTSARLRAVMRAKTGVARALVQAAERWPECHLIFLGSIAATIGNPHQAAYAAANAALEGIVHRHRQAGRRASLLALAPVCDAGLLTRAPALGRLLEDRLARHFGTRPLTVAMVVEALLTLVDQPRPPAVTTLLGPRIDPAAQPASAGEARLPILEEPAFTGLAQQTAEGEGGHAEAASAAALRAMSAAQRRPALEAELKRLAGSVLNQPPTTIDLGRPLADIGFDSLMAVDLRLAAEGALGISLPLGGLGDGVSLSDLAREMDKAMAAESQELETVADLATGNDRHLRDWATPPTAKPVPDARHREVAADEAQPTAPVEPRQRASAPARHQAGAEDRDLETLLGSHAAALSTDARASLAKALSRPDQTPTRGQNQHQRERHG